MRDATTQSAIIAALLTENPDMTTREICDRTGFRVGYVSTFKWKLAHYDHWKAVHRRQAMRKDRELNGPRKSVDLRPHINWIVAARDCGMTFVQIARQLGCTDSGAREAYIRIKKAKPPKQALSRDANRSMTK